MVYTNDRGTTEMLQQPTLTGPSALHSFTALHFPALTDPLDTSGRVDLMPDSPDPSLSSTRTERVGLQVMQACHVLLVTSSLDDDPRQL